MLDQEVWTLEDIADALIEQNEQVLMRLDAIRWRLGLIIVLVLAPLALGVVAAIVMLTTEVP